MTEEVREELVEESVNEETQEQVNPNDNFEAGFEKGATGEEPVVEEPAEEEVREEVPPEPTIDDRLAEMSSKFNQELAKVRDTAAGRIGEMNQRMQQMLSQQSSSGSSGVKLTKENLKRLSGEYPEIAEMLAEDLSESLKMNGGVNFDPSIIDQRVNERVAQERDAMMKDMEKFKLSMLHSDWEDVTRDEKFRTWLGGQPLEYQDKIGSSWDAKEIAGALTAFKEQTNRVQQQAQQKQKRLEAAVPTTKATQTAPAPDLNDAFASGFKSVRGKT